VIRIVVVSTFKPLLSKRNLHRYAAAKEALSPVAKEYGAPLVNELNKAGLYKLTHSSKAPGFNPP
jgi:hypothetical protein